MNIHIEWQSASLNTGKGLRFHGNLSVDRSIHVFRRNAGRAGSHCQNSHAPAHSTAGNGAAHRAAGLAEQFADLVIGGRRKVGIVETD